MERIYAEITTQNEQGIISYSYCICPTLYFITDFALSVSTFTDSEVTNIKIIHRSYCPEEYYRYEYNGIAVDITYPGLQYLVETGNSYIATPITTTGDIIALPPHECSDFNTAIMFTHQILFYNKSLK